MSRVLLLCFIHGFKGDDDTFQEFPYDLKQQVAKQVPDHKVESVVYPKYETKGELEQATESFLEWLKERVIDVRKEHLDEPWPPNDRKVGVVLVAHSMGGFVAADTLFRAVSERADKSPDDNTPIFPLIQGILTFDTAYNGLARSMFVYGAFSNYQKVSSVFNVMTALGAAAPASLSRLGMQRAAGRAAVASNPSSSPGWKTWQLVAVRTGTVGAIAAGGVTAYIHREAIISGMKSMKNINKDTVVEGYRSSMESVGQGLAYINRGNVGHSFAWLSDHFTFVGTLLKQKELSRRLDRMAALKGVGIKDFYTSLGENGTWSGGYFVPERTFCAIPEGDHPASDIFTRCIMRTSEDEVQAHMSMFRPEKNKGYERMTDEAAQLVKKWFLNEEDVFDDPKFRKPAPEEAAEDNTVKETLEAGEKGAEEAQKKGGPDAPIDGDVPDESPLDIAAASSLVPLSSDGETGGDDAEKQKQTYMQYLFAIAQQTGTDSKSWWSGKLPNMPNLPAVQIPSMPSVPSAVSSLGQVSMPSYNIFSKKQPASDKDGAETQDEKQGEKKAETTDDAAKKSVEEPVEKPSETSVEEPADAPAEKDAEEPVREINKQESVPAEQAQDVQVEKDSAPGEQQDEAVEKKEPDVPATKPVIADNDSGKDVSIEAVPSDGKSTEETKVDRPEPTEAETSKEDVKNVQPAEDAAQMGEPAEAVPEAQKV
ncbi:hypothetical protein HYQ45_007688 [Verticillium longisporum]|uniref:DUF676 domain-containing protein n=1 Tax=Verticillium longisporum TaxID=100787 RepID=A0A8I2ZP42_VERLO|nr:hypothetical protein HYQ45_007688 [Verticillium longisporum]